MARVVKGRSPYAQGSSRYEAFRPDQRSYTNPQELTGFQRLLRIMNVAEKVGKSPLSGLLVQGIQKLAEGAKPTMEQAIAARQGVEAPAAPTQKPPTMDEQVEQFVQQATKGPVKTTMTPAKMTVKQTEQIDRSAQMAQKNIDEFRARAYREKLTYAPSDVARILQTSGISGIDDRVFNQVVAMVADKQSREGGISMEDIESLAVRVATGQPFAPEETQPAEQAQREARDRQLQARFSELMDERKAKEELLERMEALPPKLKTRMRMLIRPGTPVPLNDYLQTLRERRAQQFFGEGKPVETAGEEELYDVLADYLRLMKGQDVPDYNALVAARGRVAEPDLPTPRPPETTEVEDLQARRREEGERAREAATAALQRPEGAVFAEVGQAVPTPRGVEFGREQISRIVDAAMGKAPPAEPAPAPTPAPEPEQAAEAPTPAPVEAEAVEVVEQTPSVRRLVQDAPAEVVRDFNQLFAQARAATTPEAQKAVLDQVSNVRLPARSFFDYMFGGPEQRARAELLKAFPRAIRQPRARTASQQEADLALAEMRRAQAQRAKAQAETGIPAQAEARQARAAVSRERAEARAKGRSITQSIIEKNLRPAARRAGRRGMTAAQRKAEIEAARKAAERELNVKFSTKGVDSQIGKTETAIQRLKAGAKGTVPNPGTIPSPPKRARGESRRAFETKQKAYSKTKAAYDKRKDAYDKDQAALKQKKARIGELEAKRTRLQQQRSDRLQNKTEALQKLNDDAEQLKGGSSAELRRRLKQRRK